MRCMHQHASALEYGLTTAAFSSFISHLQDCWAIWHHTHSWPHIAKALLKGSARRPCTRERCTVSGVRPLHIRASLHGASTACHTRSHQAPNSMPLTASRVSKNRCRDAGLALWTFGLRSSLEALRFLLTPQSGKLHSASFFR